MKRALLVFVSILMGFNFAAAKEISLENFVVNYQIVSGKEINSLFKLGEKNESDYFYVVGKIKSKLEKNALITISFEHNGQKSFKTNKVELGWIDGNNSAEKYFLIPIGVRDCALPPNPDDASCDIRVEMVK